MNIRFRISITALLASASVLVSCNQESKIRTYTESAPPQTPDIKSIMAMGASGNMPQAEKTEALVQWKLPQNWTEIPSQGMRLATFQSSQSPNLDISVVQLGSTAGGVESNIKRWFGQLELKPSDAEIQEFIQKSKSLPCKVGQAHVYDFSTYKNNSDKSTLAVIIELEKATLFIKLSGSKNQLPLEKSNLEQFVQLLENK